TDNEPLVDANDPDTKIITFRNFYFSLGFKFPLSKLFKEVFCAMGCAPSQCTPNVYRAIMCFENLSCFFMLELTVREFFYFFEVRHFELYAQVRVYKAKLFNGLSQGVHAWHDDVLEVSGRKQLELRPDMAKVHRALNIPLRFREWRWLLSEYREEDAGLPLPRMSKVGSRTVLTLMICLADRNDRKAAAKSSRGEATSSHAKDGSPSRKKPRLPFAEKTQVGSVPSSSARVKHLVGADNTKVGGMCGTWGVLSEPHADTLENHDMLREAARVRPSSAECQRDADIPPRSSSRLYRSKDGDRSGRSGHDPALLTHLEMRLAEAKKMRESSA
ncbi:Protein kinase family protein with leucine-rich repeat domain, partial [Prunus dulcis]